MPPGSIKTYSFLAALAAIALFAAGYGIDGFVRDAPVSELSPRPEGGYRIVRTDDGFSPDALVIPLGETVTFVSGKRPSWPASNIHPTHEVYSDFDPKRALAPGEEWAFTFAREGRFRFHDHLAANAVGLIEVVDTRVAARVPTRLHDCEAVPLGEKQGCWDDLLAYTLTERGFDKAFDLFVALYRTEPDVPKACHGWGHALGKAAFALNAEGEEVTFRPETSYCGYGFYHGFLEELVAAQGDARGAYAFCQRLADRAGSGRELVFNNCVHGIGHGAAADLVEGAVAGDFDALAARGAALCRSLTPVASERQDCFDGVFNELVLDLFNGLYGLPKERLRGAADPFALCRFQAEDLRSSCYFELVGTFEHLFGGDFSVAAAAVVTNVRDDAMARRATKKLAADFMQSDIVNDSYAGNVAACRSLHNGLAEPCIQGIQVGFLAHGEPEREYQKGLAFCDSPLLHDEEGDQCRTSMLSHFKQIYPPELFRKACAFSPSAARHPLCAA